MDDVTASDSLLKLWVWAAANKKTVMKGTAAVVALALVISFFLWRHAQREVKAGEALSEVFLGQVLDNAASRPDPEPGLMRVATEYQGYDAGAHALLMAAGDLFVKGMYDQARAQFERFRREYGRSALEPQALLGIAACLDAEHKPNEARTAYKRLIDLHPNDPVTFQAKYSLACLYASQNMPEMARNYFEEVAHSRGSILSSEAGMRLEEIYEQHPELAPGASAAPALTPKVTSVPSGNAPAKAPTAARPTLLPKPDQK
jgi:tetratricopeptide (TPR) repeat protein